ncbi:MAG: hypothetical protein GX756_02220 [Clostridiales bacterium]|nr:hypothetical protein [Clostridiales bacterium]
MFQFKKNFSKNTEFSFFIGKKIWNKEIYDKLCKMENITQDINFFPAYRFEEYNKKDDILIRK